MDCTSLESEGLQLQSLQGLLDNPQEECFGRVTETARMLFQVPVALVSFVDQQVFESYQGVKILETSRDAAFCHYCIQLNSTMVVEDALQDPRFQKKSFVTGTPKIRFYAGYPLVDSKKKKVGTLCLFDTKPRSLTKEEIIMLENLGQLVEETLYTRQLELDRKHYPFFDLSSDIFCIMDLHGQIEHTTSSFSRTLGYSAYEVKGKKLVDFAHPSELKANRELLSSSAQKQESSFTGRFVSKSKKVCWLAWKITFCPENSLSYAVARDVTKEKEISSELEKTKAFALKVSSAKGSFLANMSHEIRSPMNGILGFIELLESTKLDEKQKGYLERAKKLSKNLLQIANQILNFSKTESGEIEVYNSKFRTSELIDNIVDQFSTASLEQETRFIIDLDPRIPEILIGDIIKIQQILVNLISNAFKFTKDGYVTLKMELVSLSPQAASILFTVNDTGIGISFENISKLFQPFEQLANVDGKYFPGTGLGLSISQGLAQRLGGEIRVDSNPGQGSTFFFEIPLVVYTPNTKKIHKRDTQKHRILLLELEASGKPICRYLKHFGMDVVKVGDVSLLQNFLWQQLSKPWDLVLVAHELVDSYASKLLNDFGQEMKVPIVLMSGGNHSKWKRVDAETILTRPINPFELLKVIRKILAHKASITPISEEIQASNEHNLLEGARVLIAEDNEVNRQLLQDMLEKFGVQIKSAKNGKDLLEHLQGDAHVDIVLTDIEMPVMDGVELVKVIRDDPKWNQLPVIATTSNHNSENEVEWRAIGMNDFLYKPFTSKQLKKKLEYWFLNEKRNLSASNNRSVDETSVAKEVDLGIGLAKVGYNTKIYRKLLTEFVEEHNGFKSEFFYAFFAKNQEKMLEMLHSVKEGSGNISALQLIEESIRAEVKIQNRSFDNSDLENLITIMESTISNIRKALPEGDLTEQFAKKDILSLADRKLIKLLYSLEGPLQKGSPGQTRDILAKIQRIGTPKAIEDLVNSLVQQIEVYHFNNALRTLYEILDAIDPQG